LPAWVRRPVFAGTLLTLSFSGLPLVFCGSLKIIDDLALLITFRHVKPPEEKTSHFAPEVSADRARTSKHQ
jgi:hypothetical protein